MHDPVPELGKERAKAQKKRLAARWCPRENQDISLHEQTPGVRHVPIMLPEQRDECHLAAQRGGDHGPIERGDVVAHKEDVRETLRCWRRRVAAHGEP
jgi:hypothetical protein